MASAQKSYGDLYSAIMVLAASINVQFFLYATHFLRGIWCSILMFDPLITKKLIQGVVLELGAVVTSYCQDLCIMLSLSFICKVDDGLLSFTLPLEEICPSISWVIIHNHQAILSTPKTCWKYALEAIIKGLLLRIHLGIFLQEKEWDLTNRHRLCKWSSMSTQCKDLDDNKWQWHRVQELHLGWVS